MAKINKATAGIMLAAVISGGAVGAAAIPAMAADNTGSSTAAATDGYGNGYGTTGGGAGGRHQANGKTEEVLTGDTATKVEAAVKAAQPDATIERMETDADGAVYEAHITKADGTHATVLLDANFTVTGTQDQGQGGGRGGGGPNDDAADDAAASGSTSNG
jgi:uncharacterized membrane protein YkoI